MFVVAAARAGVVLVPGNLGAEELPGEVWDRLESKVVGQALGSAGLCVSVHKVLGYSPGEVLHSEGSVQFSVRCQLMMFRPFKGEVLEGTVVACHPEGVVVDCGVAQAFIPRERLQQPSEFDEQEGVWVWRESGEDLYMEVGHTVRFSVTDFDPEDSKKNQYGTAVTGTVDADGLGVKDWWLPASE